MILSLQAQASLFLLTIFLGGGMGLVYDGLRLLRRTIPHSAFWVQVEDGLFWILAVFLIFCVMLHASGGEIRFFTILGLFGGMGLYFLTLSRFVLAVSDTLLRLLRAFLQLFWCILTTPLRLMLYPFRRPLEKIGGFCGKCRKKLLQSCKICVKMKMHHLRLDWQMLRRK